MRSLNYVTLVGIGGVAGFVRTRSVPSLAAGLGIGSIYAVAGMELRKSEKGDIDWFE